MQEHRTIIAILPYSRHTETSRRQDQRIRQSRGLAQINCNGWTDFTAAQNEKGVNTVYCSEYAADGIVCEEDWLKDHEWHLYTAVLTSTTCKIYIDGEVANSWTVAVTAIPSPEYSPTVQT